MGESIPPYTRPCNTCTYTMNGMLAYYMYNNRVDMQHLYTILV